MFHPRSLPRLFLLSLGLLVLTAIIVDEERRPCTKRDDGTDDDTEDGEDLGTIVDVAAQAGTFGTLMMALKNAGLEGVLQGEGPFTVFAPTDEAFGALGERLDELLAQPDRLADILKYHVVGDRLLAASLAGRDEVTTLHGGGLTITAGEPIRVGGAKVIDADIRASNGVIHVIDAVLMPPGDQESAAKPEAGTD